MKKKLFLLPFLALGLMFAACEKENTNTTGDNPGGGDTPTPGQALTLNLNYEQVQGWLGQSGSAVESQLLQMGFVRDEEGDYEKESDPITYIKFDMINMSGYVCNLLLDDNNGVVEASMVYEAMNASCTFGTTVATFKKYTEIQNQTYASYQNPYNEGYISYEIDDDDYFYNEYSTYTDFIADINNLTEQNTCGLYWGSFYEEFSIATIADYENMEEGKTMLIGIIASQPSNDF